jgi:hypothetical protein
MNIEQLLLPLPWRMTDPYRSRRHPSAATRAKQECRAIRERDFGAAVRREADKAGSARFGVVYLAPAWHAMSVAAIMAQPPPFARRCVLFLRADPPWLTQCLALARAWGLSYRSGACIPEPPREAVFGIRSAHSLLLIYCRGEVPAPAPGLQWPSVIDQDRVGEMIRDYFPSVPRLELPPLEGNT